MGIRWTQLLLACALVSAPVARADETYNYEDNYQSNSQNQAPGTAGEATGTTTTTQEQLAQGVFASPFTVTPAFGVLGYADGANNYTSRILEGILGEYDLGALMMPTASRFTMGLQTGILYSHVGSNGSNFFGANAPTTVDAGGNSFLVPIEIAAGWAVSDAVRASIDFGTNMVYRSIGGTMFLGRPGDTQNNSVDFFPSVGFTADWAVGKSVALTLRGDYIPVPAQDMYSATLGATFGIG